MDLPDWARERAEQFSWFDYLLMLGFVLVVIGEILGWWNEVGLIAMNAIIVGELFSVKGLMKDIERNTRD